MSSNSSPQAGNTRLGLRLFLIYTLFYAAYVFVNAFAAHWSEWIVLGGLNLAVVWGFALIVLAFALAVFYGLMCTSDEGPTEADSEGPIHEVPSK